MPIKLTGKQQTLLKKVFENLNDEVNYVVLRRHEKLPADVPGCQDKQLDVDILVEKDDFQKTITILETIGFSSSYGNGNSRVKYITKALHNPIKCLKIVKKSPYKAERAMGITLLEKFSPSKKMSSYKYAMETGRLLRILESDGLKIDVKPHLSHKSPHNRKRIRLDPEVEEKMLERKKNDKEFFIPSYPDEFAHLIAHVVFDYKGAFSSYYHQRCCYLADKVFSSEELTREFDEILELIFYDASNKVFELSEKRNFEQIYDELKTLSNY